MTIAEYQLSASRQYVRDAERWRLRGDWGFAHYFLKRHIETREMSRRLAKQEKKP